ncbi:MAG: aminotransferase class V-fold PLP-dependent enzyme [Nannocystaceae bacterium]
MDDLAHDLPPPRLGERALFSDLEADVYLNHAAVSPPSLRVRRAIRACAGDYGRRGLGGYFAWADQRVRLRQELARLIGARAEDIALTSGTSAGIMAIALSFPWRRGDRVLLFTGEFPANTTSWQRAAELFGLEIVWVPVAAFLRDLGEGLEAFDAALARGPVRLVAVSAVQFRSGLRMPLAALAGRCRARGAELFVDAVQAAGVAPLDVVADDIDYLAGGAHKWLMGMEGAGYLYVRPDRVAALSPATAGWLSHEEPIRFLVEGSGHLRYDRPLRRRADVFEGGGLNALGHAALGASLSAITTIGRAAIFDHVQAYHDALEPALLDRGLQSLRAADPDARSGILSVAAPPGRDIIGLHRALTHRGIACSLPDGVLRFAPHWPNHQDEIPRVLAALDAALAET